MFRNPYKFKDDETQFDGHYWNGVLLDDKKIYIYNSLNGEKLWHKTLKFSGSSPPMTYSHNGKQYIIINSSGGKYHGYEKEFGDLIYAFKLKE